MATELHPDIVEEQWENTIWSSNRLYLSLLETFPKYVQEFQAKWSDYQNAASSSSSANTETLSSLPSFTALTGLGPKIIPLVVYQLALNPNDKTAVHLYDTLEPDTNWVPEDSSTNRGKDILRLSFERNRTVRNALADFVERCERVSVHASSSAQYTECSEYDALLVFGQSIIPHVMLEYARDQKNGGKQAICHGIGGGVLFWYELLHELVWGSKTGLRAIGDFGEIYKKWEGWFESGEGVEGAPRFGSA